MHEYYGKKALHLPAAVSPQSIFSFGKLNELLALTTILNETNLRLLMDCRPIPSEQYCSPVMTHAGYRQCPDTKLIEKWFNKGASLVLNYVDELTPEFRSITNSLGAELLGHVSTNIYASCSGHRAFDSHYDDHDVFCFHVEGTKKWRLYEGQIDNPVGQPAHRPNLQQLHNQAKGTVVNELTMKPGDFLYIPRGQYHDAVASDRPCLHVTFSVFPMNGLELFEILQPAVTKDSLFRDDLPNTNVLHGKAAMAERLALLGDRLRDLLHNPLFVEAVINRQQKRARTRQEGRVGTQHTSTPHVFAGMLKDIEALSEQ